jgi:hypothetical protein
MSYFLLELVKLTVIVSCKYLPLEAKDFFIISEISKLVVIGLVMLGLHLYSPDNNSPVQIEDKQITTEVQYEN